LGQVFGVMPSQSGTRMTVSRRQNQSLRHNNQGKGPEVITDTTVASVSLNAQGSNAFLTGEMMVFHAQARNAAGQALMGKTYTAVSSDPAVAPVTVIGSSLVMDALTVGTTNLTATCETVDSATRVVTTTQGDFMLTTAVLNNATIKLLNTSTPLIIPAPGAGRVTVVKMITAFPTFTTPYTNVDNAVVLSLLYGVDPNTAEFAGTEAFAGITDILTGVTTFGLTAIKGSGFSYNLVAGMVDKPLYAWLNNALGNVTAGHADNTLKLIVETTQITV
jgi:hypothetical protein